MRSPVRPAWIAAAGLAALLLLGCVGPQSRVDVAAEQRAANDPAAMSRIADVATHAGDPQAASIFYSRAAHLDPSNVETQIRYAQALTQQGRLEDAVGVLTQANADAAGPPRVAATLGKLLLVMHRTGPAISVFRVALAQHGDDPALLVGLGVALDTSEDPQGAQVLYHRALVFDPHSVAARNDLALSLALSGHAADAAEQFRALHVELVEAGATQAEFATVSGNMALAYGLEGDLRGAAKAAAPALTPADLANNMRFYGVLAPEAAGSGTPDSSGFAAPAAGPTPLPPA